MTVPGGEDDPDRDSGYSDGCVSNVEDSDDDGAWLRNEEEGRPPEHYLQLEENLDTSKLRQQRYSPNTQARLDWVEEHWQKYCSFVRRDTVEAYNNININALYAFLSWVCDRKQGKDGRRRGIKRLSSLQTFWKWFQMVYRAGVGRRIDQKIITQSQDLLKLIAKEKELSEERIEKGTMTVQGLVKYCRVLLATTEMLFLVSYLRFGLILYCHLIAYTSNRRSAVLEIRFGDLELSLVRDTVYGPPRLVVKVTFDYTKRFLGKKPSNTFNIPEIIYDPSLILSPHVILLGMLFHIQAFESPSLTSPEKLYSLGVLNGLDQQKLPLREELRDKFLFCEAIRDGEEVKLLLEERLSAQKINYRMGRGGEIAGEEQKVKPGVLRNGSANELNNNPDVSAELQNQIMMHASTDTFVKHYQNRNVTLNTYRNYRQLHPKADDHLNLHSMSLSIDPRRPWKLTAEESKSVNEQPEIQKLDREVKSLKRKRDLTASEEEYNALEAQRKDAQRRLNNEKQDARGKKKRQKLEDYNKKQPVIDSERQLTGQMVNEEIRSVLERTEYMTPEMMAVIDALLTLPGDSWDAEQQRRIKAINAVTSCCGVQEGSLRQYRSLDVTGKIIQDAENTQPPKNRPQVLTIEEATRSVLIKHNEGLKKSERPLICFLCLQNEKLKLQERTHSYHPGSITKHFERKHLENFKPVYCEACEMMLNTEKELLIHAEVRHGTVTRNPKYLNL